MRKLISIALLCTIVIVTMSSSCGKSGGGNGGTTPNEETLSVETSPAFNTVLPASVGPTFPLTVTVKSKMPEKGVKIEVSAVPETGGSAFYTETKTNSNASNSFTITSTPAQKSCIVTVRVTSLSKASNTVSGTYRYSMK